MDRSILVASIPHTGTFFVLDSILKDYKWQMFEVEPIPGCKMHRHLFQLGDEDLLSTRVKQCFTIVPLREYAKVEETWQRNGMNIEVLKQSWDKLYTLKDVHFLKIDSPDRDTELKRLSQVLGHSLTTDWAISNSMNFTLNVGS